MLRITVELVPRGCEANARVIARAAITNDGSGTVGRGNYCVALSCCGAPERTWRACRVEGFPRTRQNAWRLIRRALDAALHNTNPTAESDCVAVMADDSNE